jgi:hypothetical protein
LFENKEYKTKIIETNKQKKLLWPNNKTKCKQIINKKWLLL